MKIQREVYLGTNGLAVVHVRDGLRTCAYNIVIDEAMKQYPDKTVHAAVSKVAKHRFQSEHAFTGYD